MPPNRKSNVDVDVVNNVAAINVNSLLLQPKFLPLTDPREAEQHHCHRRIESNQISNTSSSSDEVIHAVHTKDASHPANSYWDWSSEVEPEAVPKQVVIDRILQEEKIRQLLSVTHLEKSARQMKTMLLTQSVMVRSNNNEEKVDDDYWFMPSEESDLLHAAVHQDVYAKQSQQALSYWDWPSHTQLEERDLMIQGILNDERCRQLFSMDHIEKNLTKQAAALMALASQANPPSPLNPENDSYWGWNNPQSASHVSDPDHPMRSYWDWPNDIDTQKEQEKTRIIEAILQEERIRQVMSVEHLEAKLISHTQQQHHSIAAHTAGADSYWDW